MKCVMFRILPRCIQTEISTWLLFQITVRTFARTLCSESGLENNICHPPLKNMSVDSGAAKIFQQWSVSRRQQMVSAFCRFLFGFTWHAASVIAQSSLGQEKLLKSHHSEEWTGSASPPGAHSQLNPCSNATTLQLDEPSRLSCRKYSPHLYLQYKFMVLTSRAVFRMYKYT